MKTQLLLVGKTADKLFAGAIADYASRIAHYMPFDVQVVPDLRHTKHISQEQQCSIEGEQLLRLIKGDDFVVLLDEHGAEMRSIELANWLEKRRSQGRRLVFVIGGPYGFSPAMYERANEKLSLSKLTFSHQMVRLVFVEQLYRACTIIRGEPYHHE